MWAGERGAKSSVIHHGSGRRGVFEALLALESRGEAQAPCFSTGEWTSTAGSSPLEIVTRGEGGSRKGSRKKGARKGERPDSPCCGRTGLSIPALWAQGGPGGVLSMEMGQSSAG